MSDETKKVDAGRSAGAWIRGFSRGITNDPPSNCPDLPFDEETSGDYTEGFRLGGSLLQAGKGIDRSSTLIVRGCPDGTEVICTPDLGEQTDPSKSRKEATPLRRAIGSGWWRIYVPSVLAKKDGDCPFISIYPEPNSLTVIDFGKDASQLLQYTYGVGSFSESQGETK
jgi:hypothetical protein